MVEKHASPCEIHDPAYGMGGYKAEGVIVSNQSCQKQFLQPGHWPLKPKSRAMI